MRTASEPFDYTIHGGLRLGGDGQLWRWTERGQETVASGGPEAVHYAESHGFPPEAVELIRASSEFKPLGGHTKG